MTVWPILASLSCDDRVQLFRAGRRQRFAKGETIFHQGDPADSVHLLANGRVAVRVLTPQGNQVIVAVLGPGHMFGELALLDSHGYRTATITAIQACETIAVRRREFSSLRLRYPDIDKHLLSSLANLVNRLNDHLLEMLFVPTPLRVARQLLVLDHEFGGNPITLTQEDLALMAGTTRATVNDVLRRLEQAGVVQIGRARIEVLDRDALTRRVGPRLAAMPLVGPETDST
jgi:CRP/FNR family cyclic AMP-dependent transcriptional regulator